MEYKNHQKHAHPTIWRFINDCFNSDFASFDEWYMRLLDRYFLNF